MQEMIKRTGAHKGLAFLEIFQNCNIFNDGAFSILTEKDTKDDHIICIKDNGYGIDEKKINQILTGKQQYTTLGTSNETGSGIGLQLCGEFIRTNKGKIWAELNPEGGSTFKFSIPK